MPTLGEVVGFGLFGLALIFAGWTGLRSGALHFRLARTSRRWPEVTGRVLSAQVEPENWNDPELTIYEPRVTYAYVVNGVAYTSNRVTVNDYGYRSWDDAEQVVATYAPGPVAVHYDPMAPQSSLLSTAGPHEGVIKAAMAALALLAGMGYVALPFL